MGSLAHLETLHLYNNQIGDDGMKAFSDAIASGSPCVPESDIHTYFLDHGFQILLGSRSALTSIWIS